MKKKTGMASVCLAMVLCFSSCAGNGSGTAAMNIDQDYPQGGFIAPSGSYMVETPKGFYALNGDFLYFINPDLQKSTIVCSKPNCLHNKTNSNDAYVLSDCDAFFRGAAVAYYDNHLYIKAIDFSDESSSLHDTIYKVSMDGSEKTALYKSDQMIHGFYIYQDTLYLLETVYYTSSQKIIIKQISLNENKEPETVFETSDFPTGTPNRFEYYNGCCYFYLLEAYNMRSFKIDLATKEITQLYQTSSEGYYGYTNDFGTLIDDEKTIEVTDKGEHIWNSTYYHISNETGEKKQLTENDLPVLSKMPTLRGMDDKYIYFSSATSSLWSEDLWPDDASIYVCDYNGEIVATIPIPEFQGHLYYVLPGTDKYLFLQQFVPNLNNMESKYYYVDKSQFNGGTLEKSLIPLN